MKTSAMKSTESKPLLLASTTKNLAEPAIIYNDGPLDHFLVTRDDLQSQKRPGQFLTIYSPGSTELLTAKITERLVFLAVDGAVYCFMKYAPVLHSERGFLKLTGYTFSDFLISKFAQKEIPGTHTAILYKTELPKVLSNDNQ